MARSTQIPNMITRSTIIYETVSPGAAGISIYIYYGSKYRVRVVQTHTVGFDGPFRSRSVTLLPDPTILYTVRRRTHSHSQTTLKNTRSSHPFTIRPFLGVPHYYWDVGLPRTPSDSLGITRTWAISRNAPKSTRSCTLN